MTPTAAAMSTSGRESRDAVAETVSGIHIPRLDRPGVRPHPYQIGPITAADNRSKRHRPLNSLPACATGLLREASLDEAERQNQIHTIAKNFRRHRWERLRPPQQRQRLLVERARSR